MTLHVRRVFGLLACIAALAAPAIAQDEPRFALVASFPSPTVSFQWELSEKFALRFDGSYNFQDESSDLSESSTGGATEHIYNNGTSSQIIFSGSSVSSSTRIESTRHAGSIGVAGIFTMYRSDQLRLYVAPRLRLTLTRERVTATTTLQFGPSLPPSILGSLSPLNHTVEQSSTSPGVGASFGGETSVHRHLALFGEAGFTYTRSDGPSIVIPTFPELLDSDTRRTTLSTRAVAGVMLRF